MPTTPRLSIPIALAAGALMLAPAEAHHGWGSYDAARLLTVNGRIMEMTYQNPHGTLRLQAPGKVWLIVLAPPFRMQNRDLPETALAVGKTVTVMGYPHRTDQIEMRAERIVVDGKTVELR